jgi:hypothetical protein
MAGFAASDAGGAGLPFAALRVKSTPSYVPSCVRASSAGRRYV